MLDLLDHNCISAKLFNEHAQGGWGIFRLPTLIQRCGLFGTVILSEGKPSLTNLKKPRSRPAWCSAACATRKTRLTFSFAGSAVPGLNCHHRVKEGPNVIVAVSWVRRPMLSWYA